MAEAEPAMDAPVETTETVEVQETPALAEAQETPALAEAPQATGYDWKGLRGTLPDEMREHTLLDTFDESGFEGLVKEHINLQRLVGGEKVTKPTEKSPPEDWDRFYNSLGRPEEAGGYDLGDFAPPEGVPWDDGLQGKMLEEFHKAGLSSKQANDVMRGYLDAQTQSFESMQEQMVSAGQQSEQALREAWGAEFDGNSQLATRAFKATFGESFEQIASLVVDGKMLGDHPVFIKAFHNLGSRMQEDGFAGASATSGFAQTPESAQMQIAEMEASREIQQAYTDRGHPEHGAVKRKLDALYRAAYPEEG